MGHFLPFYSPNSPKNQNFEKMKKMPGDIIILHKCTKNYDQVMYVSWYMVCDRCNCYFSFRAIFCPFTPLTAPKINILKKWKKHLEILSFYICVQKWSDDDQKMIKWSDDVRFLRYGAWQIWLFFILCHFCLFTP